MPTDPSKHRPRPGALGPRTTIASHLTAGVWARLVLSRSQWPADRIDRTFFPASHHNKGSSAFRRYLSCESAPRHAGRSATNNPFLQIDACWPGTYRYLVHPWVKLLQPIDKLQLIHEAMVLSVEQFRRTCFAGIGNAMRRTYNDPEAEIESIRRTWSTMDSPRLRARYFPDLMAIAIGWIQEACMLGDANRLKFVAGYAVLDRFGISWRDLSFVETTFADYLDRWLQICLIEQLNRDAHRLSVAYLSTDFTLNTGIPDRPVSLLDVAGVHSAIFCATGMDGQVFMEDLHRMSLGNTANGLADIQLSWDRTRELGVTPSIPSSPPAVSHPPTVKPVVVYRKSFPANEIAVVPLARSHDL